MDVSLLSEPLDEEKSLVNGDVFTKQNDNKDDDDNLKKLDNNNFTKQLTESEDASTALETISDASTTNETSIPGMISLGEVAGQARQRSGFAETRDLDDLSEEFTSTMMGAFDNVQSTLSKQSSTITAGFAKQEKNHQELLRRDDNNSAVLANVLQHAKLAATPKHKLNNKLIESEKKAARQEAELAVQRQQLEYYRQKEAKEARAKAAAEKISRLHSSKGKNFLKENVENAAEKKVDVGEAVEKRRANIQASGRMAF